MPTSEGRVSHMLRVDELLKQCATEWHERVQCTESGIDKCSGTIYNTLQMYDTHTGNLYNIFTLTAYSLHRGYCLGASLLIA